MWVCPVVARQSEIVGRRRLWISRSRKLPRRPQKSGRAELRNECVHDRDSNLLTCCSATHADAQAGSVAQELHSRPSRAPNLFWALSDLSTSVYWSNIRLLFIYFFFIFSVSSPLFWLLLFGLHVLVISSAFISTSFTISLCPFVSPSPSLCLALLLPPTLLSREAFDAELISIHAGHSSAPCRSLSSEQEARSIRWLNGWIA